MSIDGNYGFTEHSGVVGIRERTVRSGKQAKEAEKVEAGAGFADEMSRAAAVKPSLVLHGVSDADEGETGIGSFVDVQTGISVAVYRPKDFEDRNLVYYVKIWDAEGKLTDRMVDVSEVDSKCSNVIDMYAFACHLSSTGQDMQAVHDFMAAQAYYQGGQKGYSGEDMLSHNVNWVDIVQDFMQMQYDAGNLKGYLNYKKFLEYLE